jgi:hypothetical protein
MSLVFGVLRTLVWNPLDGPNCPCGIVDLALASQAIGFFCSNFDPARAPVSIRREHRFRAAGCQPVQGLHPGAAFRLLPGLSGFFLTRARFYLTGGHKNNMYISLNDKKTSAHGGQKNALWQPHQHSRGPRTRSPRTLSMTDAIDPKTPGHLVAHPPRDTSQSLRSGYRRGLIRAGNPLKGAPAGPSKVTIARAFEPAWLGTSQRLG